MNQNQRNLLVNRILSGYTYCNVGNLKLIVKVPTPQLLYEAEEFYNKMMEEYKFEDWYTQEDILFVLVNRGLWAITGDSNFPIIAKSIDDAKLALYKEYSANNGRKYKEWCSRLEKIRGKQAEMYTARHQYDHATLEGFAEIMKQSFIFENTTCDLNGDLFFQNNKDALLLESVIHAHRNQTIDEAAIRELVRTEPWRSHWGANKDHIAATGEELRYLVMFSKMYDNIHESSECPPDNVIENDDLLDGWLLSQKESRGHNKPKGKIPQGNEVFLPAKTADDAKGIYNSNNMQGRIVQKQREAAVKKAGGVMKDKDLPDVRQRLVLQTNQQFIKTVKGK